MFSSQWYQRIFLKYNSNLVTLLSGCWRWFTPRTDCSGFGFRWALEFRFLISHSFCATRLQKLTVLLMQCCFVALYLPPGINPALLLTCVSLRAHSLPSLGLSSLIYNMKVIIGYGEQSCFDNDRRHIKDLVGCLMHNECLINDYYLHKIFSLSPSPLLFMPEVLPSFQM